MSWRTEWKSLGLGIAVFVGIYWMPFESLPLHGPPLEALALTKWYAREHVILCLVPAFFIAGAISVFLNQQAVLRYLGPSAPKGIAYGVAAVSGAVLAVCSCTVLPLFAGIYGTGAGLGPASAFLYAGPAVNVLAIVLTASVLGPGLGVARAAGAAIFAVVIGLLMHLFFRRDEKARAASHEFTGHGDGQGRSLGQNVIYFALMVGILVFANWSRPEGDQGVWVAIYESRWVLTGAFAAGLGLVLGAWFDFGWERVALVAAPTTISALVFPEAPTIAFLVATVGLSLAASRREGELGQWFTESWGFAKQIFPLLLIGILVAGFLLGRPGREGLIPSSWIAGAVGGNSAGANLVASFAGAFMYFATLTEVPILQGLLGSGMGNGPALALLLAGPAVSLPSILVIRSVIGTRKTLTFIGLVVVMATITGLIFGRIG